MAESVIDVQFSQDTWLTTCDPPQYPQTREWGHWLRNQVTDAAGVVWLSKRDPPNPVMVLFGDRCPKGLLEDEDSPLAGRVGFEDPAGFEWLRETLRDSTWLSARLARKP